MARLSNMEVIATERGLEQGIEKGIEKGLLVDKHNVLKMQMNAKFGITPEDERVILETTDLTKLDTALKQLLFADTKSQVLDCLT